MQHSLCYVEKYNSLYFADNQFESTERVIVMINWIGKRNGDSLWKRRIINSLERIVTEECSLKRI